jgi:hypothetical protein
MLFILPANLMVPAAASADPPETVPASAPEIAPGSAPEIAISATPDAPPAAPHAHRDPHRPGAPHRRTAR